MKFIIPLLFVSLSARASSFGGTDIFPQLACTEIMKHFNSLRAGELNYNGREINALVRKLSATSPTEKAYLERGAWGLTLASNVYWDAEQFLNHYVAYLNRIVRDNETFVHNLKGTRAFREASTLFISHLPRNLARAPQIPAVDGVVVRSLSVIFDTPALMRNYAFLDAVAGILRRWDADETKHYPHDDPEAQAREIVTALTTGLDKWIAENKFDFKNGELGDLQFVIQNLIGKQAAEGTSLTMMALPQNGVTTVGRGNADP